MSHTHLFKSQLRNTDVRILLGGESKPIARTTFWRMLKNPELKFPQGIQISERVRVWDADTVLAWIESRKEEAVA